MSVDVRGVNLRVMINEGDYEDAVIQIVDMLRDPERVPENFLRMLANMIDPDGDSEMVLRPGKRGRGPRPKPFNWDIGYEISERVDEQREPFDAAVLEVAAKHRVSTSTVKSCLRKIREMRAAVEETNAEIRAADSEAR